MQDQLIDAPTALDQLVSELNHSGKSQYSGMLFAVPTRLQVHLFGMVEALTQRSGTSRNKLMNQLVEVGIQTTLGELPKEIVRQLQERSAEIIHTAVEKNSGFESGDL